MVNLFVEGFETKAISTAPNTQCYASGMWMTPLSSKRQNTATSSYNTSTPLTIIQLTAESLKSDGSILLFDTLVSPGPDTTHLTNVYRKLGPDTIHLTNVYRKPTHMDQYLNGDSHHSLSAKYSVFSTPAQRGRTVSAKPRLHKEKGHIKRASQRCEYPNLVLNRLKFKSNHTCNTTQANNKTNNKNNYHSNIHIVVPYTKG